MFDKQRFHLFWCIRFRLKGMYLLRTLFWLLFLVIPALENKITLLYWHLWTACKYTAAVFLFAYTRMDWFRSFPQREHVSLWRHRGMGGRRRFRSLLRELPVFLAYKHWYFDHNTGTLKFSLIFNATQHQSWALGLLWHILIATDKMYLYVYI